VLSHARLFTSFPYTRATTGHSPVGSIVTMGLAADWPSGAKNMEGYSSVPENIYQPAGGYVSRKRCNNGRSRAFLGVSRGVFSGISFKLGQTAAKPRDTALITREEQIYRISRLGEGTRNECKSNNYPVKG